VDIKADIPGVKKEDINIDIEKDVLSLSVDSKQEADKSGETDGVTWHHTERSHTFIKRSLRMPETADMENVAANYKDGTLSITVPKKAATAEASKRIAIN
jgi:HSP20 family protein